MAVLNSTIVGGKLTVNGAISQNGALLSDTYAARSHNHDSSYAAIGHNHNSSYIRMNQTSDSGAMTWGTLTAANGYNIISHISSSDGGDWGMCYKDGQISMQLDGYYYQNEGKYRVLDTNQVSSNNNTASWGSAVTVGTVGGTDLKFTMPANPNTDHYNWSDITNKPSTFTPSSHTHDYLPLSKVSSLNANSLTANTLYFAQTSITNGAHTNHSMLLDVSNVGTPFQMQICDSDQDYIYKRHWSSGWTSWRKMSAGYADSAGSVAWGNVSGKPSSYTPSSHSHSWSEITSKPSSTGGSATFYSVSCYWVISYIYDAATKYLTISGEITTGAEDDWRYGLVNDILSACGLSGSVAQYFISGAITSMAASRDYGAFLRVEDWGYPVITCGRFYTTSGGYGNWKQVNNQGRIFFSNLVIRLS